LFFQNPGLCRRGKKRGREMLKDEGNTKEESRLGKDEQRE